MDILRAIMEGAEGPTDIMARANLSSKLLAHQITALAEMGFVGEKTVGNRKKYSLTGKGIQIVGAYLNVIREIIFDTISEPRGTAFGGEREYLPPLPRPEHLRKAFGVDGPRALAVARMINLERHNENA